MIVFFNVTSTTEIYTYWHTVFLHDSLPIYAGKIDLDDALPILVRDLVPDGVAKDAGMVDDRVDAAEFGDRILDDARGILRIGDVAEVGDGLAARSDDVGCGRFGRSGVAAVARLRDAGVVDHDGGPLRRAVQQIGRAHV